MIYFSLRNSSAVGDTGTSTGVTRIQKQKFLLNAVSHLLSLSG